MSREPARNRPPVVVTPPDARCPVCSEPFHANPAGIACPDCRTPHHLDCWQYNGRCGIFACSREPVRQRAGEEPLVKAPPGKQPGPPLGDAPGMALARALARLPVKAPRKASREDRWRQIRRSVGSVLLVLAIATGAVAAVAVPGFKSARERANTRACYANQKTIAGALEMYNLDKNTKVTVLGTSVFTLFKSGGYM